MATKKERTYAQDVGDKCKPAFSRLVHYHDKGAQDLSEPCVLLAGDDGCAPGRNIGRSDFRMSWNPALAICSRRDTPTDVTTAVANYLPIRDDGRIALITANFKHNRMPMDQIMQMQR